MQKPSFELEEKLYKQGYDFVVGIDEAGRGPLAGPVVAAAAATRNFEFSTRLSNGQIFNFQNTPSVLRTSPPQKGGEKWNLIRDSKTLSEKQREKIYGFIMKNFFVGVGICDHNTIDRINILQASFLAMKASLTDLKSKIKMQKSQPKADQPLAEKLQIKNQKCTPSVLWTSPPRKGGEEDVKYIILVDGNKEIPNFSGEQVAVPQGDQKIKSISAASIIAKVTRDRIMREAHKKYPRYSFNRHKGYGTKLHMEMLREHGPCKIHRRSFRPVGKRLDNKNHAG